MEAIKTKDPRFTIRFAQPDDAGTVVAYMRKLGAYQKMADKIIAQEGEMQKILAEKSNTFAKFKTDVRFDHHSTIYCVDVDSSITIYILKSKPK